MFIVKWLLSISGGGIDSADLRLIEREKSALGGGQECQSVGALWHKIVIDGDDYDLSGLISVFGKDRWYNLDGVCQSVVQNGCLVANLISKRAWSDLFSLLSNSDNDLTFQHEVLKGRHEKDRRGMRRGNDELGFWRLARLALQGAHVEKFALCLVLFHPHMKHSKISVEEMLGQVLAGVVRDELGDFSTNLSSAHPQHNQDPTKLVNWMTRLTREENGISMSVFDDCLQWFEKSDPLTRDCCANAVKRFFLAMSQDNSLIHISRPPSIIGLNKSSLLNSVGDLLYLQYHLPKHCRIKWTRLFNSLSDGHAWQPFINSIQYHGSLLIIAQDKQQYRFGVFVSEQLSMRPSFYGTSDNFLFTLDPSYGLYHASSYNTNYQYLNDGSKTLTNGLGFGGQVDYFGLFINNDLLSGHSKAHPVSSTYQNPQLSATEQFDIEAVEVWQVCEPSDEEISRNVSQGGRGVMGRNQVLEFLDMAGVQTFSKDFTAPKPGSPINTDDDDDD